jgi:histidine triad (HIT) family protein
MVTSRVEGCRFCSIAAGEEPGAIVLDTEDVVAFLDHRPLFKGHTLVVPRAHVVTLLDLDPTLRDQLFASVQRVTGAVQEAMGAAGSFVAMNNVVSQSVPHLHVHVVPRNPRDGLRGFFWPRQRYDDAADLERHAAAVRLAFEAMM